MTPLELATLFHETYERLAPDFGYTTRPETRAFNPETPNGRLMVAVCAEIMGKLRPQVVFVDGDDWQGLYINGRLIEEGHHIHLDDLLKHLGIDGEVICPDDAWLTERGGLPMDLAEVRE